MTAIPQRWIAPWLIYESGLNHGDEIRLCIGGKTRSPREVTQEAELDNTCGSHDHSRHRTATDPISVRQTVNIR